MARINDGVLKEWLDGQVVKSNEYKQEREIIRVAINDNYDRLVQKYDKTEVDSLLSSLQEDVDNRYTKEDVDTLLGQKVNQSDVYLKGDVETRLDQKANQMSVYTKEEIELRLANTLGDTTGFVDGGNFTDTFSSQYNMLDGGEF